MNPMITPDVVAAEVAYRYERDHVVRAPHTRSAGTGMLHRLLHRRALR